MLIEPVSYFSGGDNQRRYAAGNLVEQAVIAGNAILGFCTQFGMGEEVMFWTDANCCTRGNAPVKMFNIFDEMPGIVRQFAGNWFIINSVEPDIALLSRHLRGIRAFYHFLYNQRLISAGFLWNMVRIMVGSLVQVGMGRYTPDDIGRMLREQDRNAAGHTAPAHGLYLQWIRT